MACDVNKGRTTPCKDVIGGLDAVYFINDGDIAASDVVYDVTDTDLIATTNWAATMYKYDLKGASTYTETITSDRATGTTFFQGVLELQLPKLTKEDHKQIKLLAYGNPKIVLLDNNGNYLMGGLKFGFDITGGTIVTGGAMGDMSGYTLTFTSEEPVPMNFFNDTTEAGLLANCGLTTVSS